MMNYLPQSIEELVGRIDTASVLQLDAAIKHISELPSVTLNIHSIKKQVDSALEELVQKRLNSALKSGAEAFFVESTSQELQRRFDITHYFHSSYIKPVIAKYFQDQFVQHLKCEIEMDSDIDKKSFVTDFLNKFAMRFGLNRKDLHSFSLVNKINRYFPSDEFHSVKTRKKRYELEESRFQQTLSNLNMAYKNGQRHLKNNSKDRFKPGYLAETAWVEVMRDYFGQQFDVYQDTPIKIDTEFTPKIDIILTKKDRSHKSPASVDYINSEDVVAAFEVKRTLIKGYIELGSKQSKEIFDERCMALKAAVMPKNRVKDRTLTPYQMLRGKIYFGILSLDIAPAASNELFNGNNHAERHVKGCYPNDDQVFQFSDFTADIIYCPGKLLWAKETKLMPSSLADQVDIYLTQIDGNTIDLSVSTFGYLIASMRRFFVAQGHIPKADQSEYLKHYQHFAFLPSANSSARVLIRSIDNNIPEHVRELYTYLRTEIPNEYSNGLLVHRPPLAVMKQWSSEAAQDISGYLKRHLKRIVKLELQRNYKPLPFGVSLDDASFDTYFDSLLSD